ncbi:MAG: hypothetical protein P0S95_01080 [Rhabdochlamydiaceae bacterium]|nr:hypothetical protein [Candidatus Amphrikana amoebophyrae]
MLVPSTESVRGFGALVIKSSDFAHIDPHIGINITLERIKSDLAAKETDAPLKAEVKAVERQPLVNRSKVVGQSYMLADVVSIMSKGTYLASRFSPHGTNPGLRSAFGLVSAVGFVGGAVDIIGAKTNYDTAKKVGYVWGQREAVIKGFRGTAGVFSAMNATANSLFDCLSYEGFVTSCKTSFCAIRVLGHVATIAGGCKYLAVFSTSGNNLRRSYQLSSQLSEIEKNHIGEPVKGLKAQIKHLCAAIELTSLERYVIIDQVRKEDFSEKVELTDSDLAKLTPKDIHVVNAAKLPKAKAKLALKKMADMKTGKEMDLSDRTGPLVVAKLRAETMKPEPKRLVSLLAKQNPDASDIEAAKEIITEAKKDAKSRILMNVLVMSIAVIGIATAVAADFATAGTLKFVLIGIGLAISAYSMGMDTIMMMDGFRSSQDGKYDEMLKWFVNTVAIAVSALAVFYTAGTPLLIMGVISASIVLSVNFGIWYKNKYGKPLDPPKDLSERAQVRRDIFISATAGPVPHFTH